MLTPDFSSFPVLHTDRLVLRKICTQDLEQAYRLRSNPNVYRYISRPLATSMDDAQAFLQRVDDNLENNNGVQWAMCLRGDDTMIGTIGIWRIEKENYRGEVGYMLMEEYQNKGLMSEAFTAVVHYGFNQLGLHSIEAKTDAANSASRALLERIGFVQEALFRENIFYNGHFADTTVYSLVAQPK